MIVQSALCYWPVFVLPSEECICSAQIFAIILWLSLLHLLRCFDTTDREVKQFYFSNLQRLSQTSNRLSTKVVLMVVH